MFKVGAFWQASKKALANLENFYKVILLARAAFQNVEIGLCGKQPVWLRFSIVHFIGGKASPFWSDAILGEAILFGQ